MSLRLYEIHAEIQELLDQADPETGEISEEVSKALDALQIKLEEKLEGCGCYIKALRAESRALDEEIGNLRRRKLAKERKAESIQKYVEEHFTDGKLETPRVRLRWTKNPPRVLVEDLKSIPPGFFDTPEPVLSKRRILEALKGGEEVTGASLKQDRSLRID